MFSTRPLWLHGASHGDVNALRPHLIRARQRVTPLILSAVTHSGRARWRRIAPSTPHALHLRPPLLSKRRAQRLLKAHDPSAVLFELLEVWPAWVNACESAGIPTVVIDGRISSRTLHARPLLHPSFRRLSAFLAQTSEDANRAAFMGVRPEVIHVCGSGKYDAILSPQYSPLDHTEDHTKETHTAPLGGIASFDLIIGCLRPEDERPAMELMSTLNLFSRMRVLIAPRYLSQVSRLLKRLRAIEAPVALRSDSLKEINAAQCVILDTLGELDGAYTLAPIAIIGGTFGRRGQGLIEAARAGCTVIYGTASPHLNIEREALDGRGGYPCADWRDALMLASSHSQGAPLLSPHRDDLDALCGAVDRQALVLNRLIGIAL